MKGRNQESDEAWLRKGEAGKISLGKLLDMESKWCRDVSLTKHLNP